MAKYRKKPVVIDAIQWTGDNDKEIENFIIGTPYYFTTVSSGSVGVTTVVVSRFLVIETLEGTMSASINDYIIKGVNGEYYSCKPDIFEKTYEIVEG